jgi:hypothetical protein
VGIGTYSCETLPNNETSCTTDAITAGETYTLNNFTTCAGITGSCQAICSINYIYNNGICVPLSCPAGYLYTTGCPAGYYNPGGNCPAGTMCDGGTCL